MLKLLLTVLAVSALTGCGAVDKYSASITGKPSEVCHDGVIYLQFISGVTVKYLQNNDVATCK